MGSPASYKLAFTGLYPELQAEVRKYRRQHSLKELSLEKLFAVAGDAEVGLRTRKEDRRKGWEEGKEEGKREWKGRKDEKGWKGGKRIAMLQGKVEGDRSKGRGEEDKKKNQEEEGRKSTATCQERGCQSEQRDDRSRIREMCWVCDGFGHGWYYCNLKKPGKGCPTLWVS